METHYLNVDLDVESNDDLTLLVKDLGGDVAVLHHGTVKGYNHAAFELAHGLYAGPDEALSGFCTLIENLSPEARTIWDNCFTRLFDFGFEAGDSPNRFWVEIRPSTISRVASINASIAISLYPLRNEKN